MADPVNFNVVRTTDGDCAKALLNFAKSEVGENYTEFVYLIPGVEEKSIPVAGFESNEFGQELLRCSGRSVRRMGVRQGSGGNTPHLYVTRAIDGAETVDKLTINFASQPSAVDVLRVSDAIQSAFRSVPADIKHFLDAGDAKRIDTQEELLTRLHGLSVDLVDRNAQQVQKNLESHAARMEQSENDYIARKQTLEAEFKAKSDAVSAEKAEIEKLRGQLDSSRNVRRQLREKLKEELKSAASVSFSAPTNLRRTVVATGYLLLLSFFVAAFFTSTAIDPKLGISQEYWNIGRQICSSIGIVVTATFCLKWLNRMAEQSATQELKLQQLSLDIDRGSWLVELVLECIEAKGPELPPTLVEHLSRNLFATGDDAPEHSMTAIDALATALLGNRRPFKSTDVGRRNRVRQTSN